VAATAVHRAPEQEGFDETSIIASFQQNMLQSGHMLNNIIDDLEIEIMKVKTSLHHQLRLSRAHDMVKSRHVVSEETDRKSTDVVDLSDGKLRVVLSDVDKPK
jgi:hypothetical protein